MTSFSPGDVILVPFPFTDMSGGKKRPALVLATDTSHGDLVCMMITSVIGHREWEVEIQGWSEAGLLKPSVAQVTRLFSVSASIVERRLGALTRDDLRRIRERLAALLDLEEGRGPVQSTGAEKR